MRTRERSWLRLARLGALALFILATCVPSFAQATGSAPHDANGNTPLDLSQTLERITDAATDMIPSFVKTVEAPLGPYFDFLAWYFAWLIMIMFILKVVRSSSANDPEDLFWAFARCAVCFALLSYCGDTNGDGIRGDLINRLGKIGNSIAYGDGRCDTCGSFIQRNLREKQQAFGNAYVRFTENRFMYRIDNQDRLVRYPDDEDKGYQMLAAIYSGTHSPQEVTNKFNPNNWSMGNLFQFLNFGRGLVEFGDLFLLILQGFLVASIRLAAPFMVAVAIDREHAKRISIPYAWGVVVITLVMPVVSQIIRFFAFTIATLPMGLGGTNNPYFKFDPSTAKVIALGNPEYSIIIAALVMTICGLSMFASPYLSYKLAQGSVFEAITGVVSGWMGGIVSTGVSTYSSAMASAITNQAERQQATQGAIAEGVTAKSALDSSNRSAAAQQSNSIALSRSTEQAEVGSAQVTAWSAAARADAQQEKLETEQNAAVVAGDIERDARLGSANVTATAGLDDAYINNSSALGSVLGVGDNIDRAVGGGGGSSDGVLTPRSPDWNGALSGSSSRSTEAVGRMAATNEGGRYGAPRDYNNDGQKNEQHVGLDVAGFHKGDAVGAAREGTVAFAGKTKTGGNTVMIDHGDGTATRYRHLQDGSTNMLEGGQHVARGDFIGRVGNTGTSSHGDHLHFETGTLTGRRARGGEPGMTYTDPNKTNLRPINLSTGTVAGGRPGAYQVPKGVADTLAATGGNSRGFTRAKRDAYIPLENAQREAVAGATAERYRTGETIRAGQVYTNREISIASHEAGARSQIARVAGGQREQAARGLYRGSVEANTITYQGQAGNPRATAGTPENMGAIEIRRKAAVEAAQQRAMASVLNSLGSTIASQVNGVFTQFNRY